MQGNPKVIALLNEALKEELAAINQYLSIPRCARTGTMTGLAAYQETSIEEMKHAEALIERILFWTPRPA